ncbi:sensor histidine kinase [Aureimonas pseudogalii]|uniref:histidine kinase n=1 Tax=Aureimonas pseudogalii TaxID=1744844 RepID=A0A7W6EAN5_9HYPH|nr:HAMP domain-containing sensor histidine kinase [Aureimonas pseudogalii]MBB3996551.1 signal transduction histidine kinase [Aureimonas pseudogalii]
MRAKGLPRLRDLTRVTAVRLSAVYLALFAVFAAILLVYVTGTASSILQTQNRETISEEISELGRIYGGTGIAGLVRSIDRRTRQPGASLYLVTDVTGRILAGNVESIEAGILDDPGFTVRPFRYARFTENEANRYHLAVAQVVRLPNGMRILVGRDQTDQDRIRLVVRNALILALGLMMVGALVAWFLVGRTALHRLDRMSASTARIMGGDLGERLPVSGTGDEFDRLSENLNLLLARISLLQEGLRQVSDNIAHDLKTPLTRLRNRIEASLTESGAGRDARPALESILAEADGMIRTFDALLMISRVEAGSHPALKTEVDLSEIVGGVVELYEPLAEDAGAVLVLSQAEPIVASVSRELIAQALSNLIDNALKYGETPDRGLVVSVALARRGDNAVLSVRDNGPGIPADRRHRVLERFYRLDQSRSKPGSGLGLSLVQAIAGIHEGSLSLADAEPGLKVELEFPVTAHESVDERI